ncbi:MAG: hypothetical protein RL483_1172 [Pseudomonadota bacterium]|jgi:phosphoribosyl-ATP pyrophosphohydrolase
MASDILARLAQVVAAREAGDPNQSYVARLLAKAPDAALKKIGEEATEVVMAAKDLDALGPSSADADRLAAQQRLVGEMADLWFHSLVALHQAGLQPAQVLAELERREGLSGLDEKAARKAQERGA